VRCWVSGGPIGCKRKGGGETCFLRQNIEFVHDILWSTANLHPTGCVVKGPAEEATTRQQIKKRIEAAFKAKNEKLNTTKILLLKQ
jgi:hypothetical protein